MILVDVNEPVKIIGLLQKLGVEVVRKDLPVGDYHVAVGETPWGIVERKTAGDFMASLRDGRYFDQRWRLAREFAYRAWIFEIPPIQKAPLFSNAPALTQETLYHAVCSLSIVYKIQVFYSQDLEGTARILKEIDDATGRVAIPAPITNPGKLLPGLEDSVRMLMGVAGIGEEIARRILREYSISELRDLDHARVPGLGKIRADRIIRAISWKEDGTS